MPAIERSHHQGLVGISLAELATLPSLDIWVLDIDEVRLEVGPKAHGSEAKARPQQQQPSASENERLTPPDGLSASCQAVHHNVSEPLARRPVKNPIRPPDEAVQECRHL